MKNDDDEKSKDLEVNRSQPGEYLTTNHGTRVSHTDDSLKAGARGPTLMEDFHFREKMTHFDHERIPERVVHARGSAAHGYFQPYESLSDLTAAKVFADPAVRTPVFVRFSTVVGFRGSADTVRDVRGFATKFYTEEGVWDLVGNNMPVFFIQDAVKFPDLVHAIKPEPHNQMPQASAAHDNFWDFVGLVPESLHTIMWVLSDRGLPRSYAMMQGFGVHTFRFVNAAGQGRFVKFHWTPTKGVQSLVWDETQKIAGKNPDFNRRDLWMAIERGDYPEFELGVQIVEEENEHDFDFDLLDPTKLIPEEEVPVRAVGKMVLNRNPDNFFAETEQVAFHPGHVVPGIDFTNDPLLQGRLFSYIDTQITRLGGPNFSEIPINRPLAPVHNNQRDGIARQTINTGRTNYFPNSVGGGCPMTANRAEGGYVHYSEKVEGEKVKARSDSFRDFYSQATLFWNSMTAPEQRQIVNAAHFELGKVMDVKIRERVVEQFNHVDHDFAVQVARGVGVDPPASEVRPNHGRRSARLSMVDNFNTDSIAGRKVAILAADGFDGPQLTQMKEQLEARGAVCAIVSKIHGTLTASDGTKVKVDKPYITTAPVLFDGVYIPGGKASVAELKKHGDALLFINETFKHLKALGATGEACELLSASAVTGVKIGDAKSDSDVVSDRGVISARNVSDVDDVFEEFSRALATYRHWDRNEKLGT